ncbi:TetR/AcrR family transcriptional regulator C-terminal domain-containing protein [Actinoplanes sp. NPDC051861]|uniref:TetR/AcrR family transcriptional regulator n=1 Tax=Actinoplanes sp. NPDC051861 TaxID=3155170 RepID=UPI003426AE65
MARGRPPAYTREQVVDASIRLADADGLDAVTMRRVAAEIGAGAMSLYTYVPDREHLIDLMVDAVAGEPDLPALTGDWRADLFALVSAQRDLMHRHPWLPGALTGRGMAGRNMLGLLEHGLGAMEPTGLPGATRMALLGMFTGFVASYVTSELAGASTGEDQAAQIGSAVAGGDFPRLAAVVAEGGGPVLNFARVADWVINGLVRQAGDSPR